MPAFTPGEIVLFETARTAKHYVYALLDDSDAIFYIGRTFDPHTRLRAHIYTGSPLIRARLKQNKAQRMRILAGPMTEQEAAKYETEAIHHAAESGIVLVNQECRPSSDRKRLAVFEQFTRKD